MNRGNASHWRIWHGWLNVCKEMEEAKKRWREDNTVIFPIYLYFIIISQLSEKSFL